MHPLRHIAANRLLQPRAEPTRVGEVEAMSDGPISLAERQLQPCADVVDVAERILEMAKAGKICAIAIAYEAPGACTGTAFAMGDGDVAHVLLPIERLKLRLLTEA